MLVSTARAVAHPVIEEVLMLMLMLMDGSHLCLRPIFCSSC
jgi:hypothetical protein